MLVVETLEKSRIDMESLLFLFERTFFTDVSADYDDRFVNIVDRRGLPKLSKEELDILVHNFNGGGCLDFIFAASLTHVLLF